MRLDGLGKPPLVPPLDDQAKVQDKKRGPVSPAENAEGLGTSTTPDREPKLGVIIDLIERAQKLKKLRKKSVSKKEVSDAIKKYQWVGKLILPGADPEKQIGQTLDQKA